MKIQPVAVDRVHPAALKCVFWEFGSEQMADPAIEKEAWLSAVLLTYGICGFSAVCNHTVAGTALFAPPSYLPGALEMPSGPPSSDAVLLSSVFADMYDPNMYAVLIDASLANLLLREVSAVEAFGWKAGSWAHKGLIPAQSLEEAGFWLVAPHDEVPRYRIELPPAEGLLAEAEVAELLRVMC